MYNIYVSITLFARHNLRSCFHCAHMLDATHTHTHTHAHTHTPTYIKPDLPGTPCDLQTRKSQILARLATHTHTHTNAHTHAHARTPHTHPHTHTQIYYSVCPARLATLSLPRAHVNAMRACEPVCVREDVWVLERVCACVSKSVCAMRVCASVCVRESVWVIECVCVCVGVKESVWGTSIHYVGLDDFDLESATADLPTHDQQTCLQTAKPIFINLKKRIWANRVSKNVRGKPIFTNLKKVLDYLLRSNKSNINQYACHAMLPINSSACCRVLSMVHRNVDTFELWEGAPRYCQLHTSIRCWKFEHQCSHFKALWRIELLCCYIWLKLRECRGLTVSGNLNLFM